MTMITPSYLGETIEYSSLHACRSTLEDPTLVTPSRRTGEENTALLKSALSAAPAFVWDGTGENPYFGILGLADNIVVTADSVNMISEACATGKPVYVYDLPGGSAKSARFRDALLARGLVRSLEVPLVPYPAHKLDEMAAVVAAIGDRIRVK